MDKIDIIYRCCEAEVDPPYKFIRPSWFNKLKCLDTFLESVKQNTDFIGRLIFVHDGPEGKLYNRIPQEYEIRKIDVQNNEACLLHAFKIADELTNNIYFVEDDYLHLTQSVKTIYHGVKNFKLVTGYDHLDRYTRTDDISYGKEYIAFSKKTNCHWRTVESTCCTWACTRQLWNSVIRTYATKYKLNDRDLFRSLNIEQNIRLWSPIPGVTTQVDKCLSPGIEWNKI